MHLDGVGEVRGGDAELRVVEPVGVGILLDIFAMVFEIGRCQLVYHVGIFLIFVVVVEARLFSLVQSARGRLAGPAIRDFILSEGRVREEAANVQSVESRAKAFEVDEERTPLGAVPGDARIRQNLLQHFGAVVPLRATVRPSAAPVAAALATTPGIAKLDEAVLRAHVHHLLDAHHAVRAVRQQAQRRLANAVRSNSLAGCHPQIALERDRQDVVDGEPGFEELPERWGGVCFDFRQGRFRMGRQIHVFARTTGQFD
mmetsp:Transcript_16270/g.54860  ORF Transcript_16270/g.54860 Transcript_16270/m.54860 type:complete len:258 (+) Transcript_16270:1533-2306(+)